MRNISFFHTQQQVLNHTKRQTRRLGWWNLKVGELLQGIDKGQGLKPGQHPLKLCIIRVEYARPEVLNTITQEDVIEEGFPDFTPKMFVEFFCDNMKCEPIRIVNAIRFDYEDERLKLL